VVAGLLYAFTPILIVWGAIFLFRTMEAAGAMDTLRAWLNTITQNRVAQLMIVGWAFAFLIEGASGFGTPAALAAPVLVGLGFPPVRVAILCLIMNSVPVSFGAVGTPTWFGFSEIQLTQDEILAIGAKTAILHSAAALVIPLLALWFVVAWQEIRANLLFVYLSILSCVVPYAILAHVDYEFPTIVGGLIGLLASVALARMGVGLVAAASPDSASPAAPVSLGALIRAGFPLWGTVVVLVVTRIQQLGIKGLLNDATPWREWTLGSLGVFGMNGALVLQMKSIFCTNVDWSHKVLYVPSIVPFVLVSIVTFALFRVPRAAVFGVCRESLEKMRNPVLALLGALVFVKLLMMGGKQEACTHIIGGHLAETMGNYWRYAAVYLGALGSFFSGSNTVSNLTFAGIQDAIAASLELERTTILALQSAGGAMGNMVCINNIVAVCSVLSLDREEGFILKRTTPPLIVYGIIVALAGLLL